MFEYLSISLLTPPVYPKSVVMDGEIGRGSESRLQIISGFTEAFGTTIKTFKFATVKHNMLLTILSSGLYNTCTVRWFTIVIL